MNILALDCATKTGWASQSNGKVESGVQDFSLKRGESVGMRFVRFNYWLRDIIAVTQPEIVVYEMPHQRGGAPTEVLLGMTTRIQEKCDLSNIEYTQVHSATLKKFATGSGRASKVDMLRTARTKWGAVEDDNQADALWMLEWAKKEFSNSQ